jgi:hypothetical protein
MIFTNYCVRPKMTKKRELKNIVEEAEDQRKRNFYFLLQNVASD